MGKDRVNRASFRYSTQSEVVEKRRWEEEVARGNQDLFNCFRNYHHCSMGVLKAVPRWFKSRRTILMHRGCNRFQHHWWSKYHQRNCVRGKELQVSDKNKGRSKSGTIEKKKEVKKPIIEYQELDLRGKLFSQFQVGPKAKYETEDRLYSEPILKTV